MSPKVVKNLVRVTVPLALAGTLLAVPTPAQAARQWHQVLTLDGAKAQVCKERAGKRWRVYVRVNNRAGDHWHEAGLTRYSGKKYFGVRARAGRVSGVTSLLTKRGVRISISDRHTAYGGWTVIKEVGRC